MEIDWEALREDFEERAGILEYDAGLPRAEAEFEACRMTGYRPAAAGVGQGELPGLGETGKEHRTWIQ